MPPSGSPDRPVASSTSPPPSDEPGVPQALAPPSTISPKPKTQPSDEPQRLGLQVPPAMPPMPEPPPSDELPRAEPQAPASSMLSPSPPPTVCDSTVCFDCDAELTTAQPWVSVSYGISLCLECAGHHRSIGVHLSFVRSLELDVLTARETRSLVLGGNASFSVFLADPQRGVPRHVWLALPLRERYVSAAAVLYRQQLAASLDAEEAQAGALLGSQPVTAKLTSPIGAPATAAHQALPTVRWTPDSEAPRCQLCKVTFGMVFNRRHHCRKCGRCVCDSCSPAESWRAMAGSEDAVRHCKLCVTPTRAMAGLSLPFET